MNWKRLLFAVGVAFVAAVVVDLIVNAILLRDVFEQTARFWRPPEELNRLVPLGLGSLLATMACFALLFARLGGQGVRRGLEFGFWLSMASTAGVVGMISLVPWPMPLIASMAAQQAANNLLLGFCLGWLYRPSAS